LEELTDNNALVARLGGDEFGVIFPGSSLIDATSFIDQLTDTLNNYNTNSQKPYKISFSAGLVEFNVAKHLRPADLMREADSKMYDIKRNT